MKQFLIIWFGQLISTIGSGFTSFALGIWVYQKTGSTTLFALVPTLIYLPGILISPFVGIVIDRLKFRKSMILSYSGASLNTVIIAILLFTNNFQTWHLYCTVAVNSLFSAFQWTAYSTVTAQFVPQKHLTRANALVEIARATAKIFAPLMAGMLLSFIKLQVIVIIDFFTFIIAIITIFLVEFKNSQKTSTINDNLVQKKQNKLNFNEIKSGYNYINAHPGLFLLMIFLSFIYFFLGVLEVLFTPLVLSISSTSQLGIILSFGGLGWLIGSIIISFWGGPKRRINGVLVFSFLQGIWLLFGALKPSVEIVGLGVFGYLFFYPFIVSCNEAIWQKKVPFDLQGRVFSTRLMFEWLALPLGYIISGPLAEFIFEPLLMPTGILASTIGKLIGTGTGRGIGFLCITIGAIIICLTILSYQNLQLRSVED